MRLLLYGSLLLFLSMSFGVPLDFDKFFTLLKRNGGGSKTFSVTHGPGKGEGIQRATIQKASAMANSLPWPQVSNDSSGSTNTSWYRGFSYEIPFTVYTSPDGQKTLVTGRPKAEDMKKYLGVADPNLLTKMGASPNVKITQITQIGTPDATTSTPDIVVSPTEEDEDESMAGMGGSSMADLVTRNTSEFLGSDIFLQKLLTNEGDSMLPSGFGDDIGSIDKSHKMFLDWPGFSEMAKSGAIIKTFTTRQTDGKNENTSTIMLGDDGRVTRTQVETWKEEKLVDRVRGQNEIDSSTTPTPDTDAQATIPPVSEGSISPLSDASVITEQTSVSYSNDQTLTSEGPPSIQVEESTTTMPFIEIPIQSASQK